ncbi:MAG: NAD(P)/FAD-dependent oxidoreductase, partial [Desulfomonilia bacterium]
DLAGEILQPLLHVPRHPGLLLSFGLKGIQPVDRSARRLFRTDKVQALFAGLGTHAVMPLDSLGTTAFALFMGASAHATGWPIPKGGAQRVTDALVTYLQSLYVEFELRRRVYDFRDLPYSQVLFLDLTPRQILWITRDRLPRRHRLQLQRYGYGPGVCKVDWALKGPIPWTARECREALTLHLGGTYQEIALSERQVRQGVHPAKPFVICVQPSIFDASRAPEGRHTAWAYCHVPHASHRDVSTLIEQQIERFAPGFTKLILSRRVITAEGLHERNPNLVGGDITGGANTFFQLLFRPDVSLKPYAFGWSRFRVCSASSPPGGGVHGMCGYNAARRALAEIWKMRGRCDEPV